MPSPGQKIFDAESEGLYDFVSKNGRGLYNLPGDDEFPDFLSIVQDDEKQDTLFGEEFPETMTTALESVLSPQLALAHAAALDGGKLSREEKQSKKWWEDSINLVSLLFFSKFALERITLVVVTARRVSRDHVDKRAGPVTVVAIASVLTSTKTLGVTTWVPFYP